MHCRRTIGLLLGLRNVGLGLIIGRLCLGLGFLCCGEFLLCGVELLKRLAHPFVAGNSGQQRFVRPIVRILFILDNRYSLLLSLFGLIDSFLRGSDSILRPIKIAFSGRKRIGSFLLIGKRLLLVGYRLVVRSLGGIVPIGLFQRRLSVIDRLLSILDLLLLHVELILGAI